MQIHRLLAENFAGKVNSVAEIAFFFPLELAIYKKRFFIT